MKPSHPSTAEGDPRARLKILNSVALRTAVVGLEAFTHRLGSALTEASLKSDESAASLHAAAEHLSREHASFRGLYADCLQQALKDHARRLFGRSSKRLRGEALDLSAQSFEAMQCKVVLENHAQALDRAHALQLAELQDRLSNWLGSELGGTRMPFRAEIFVHALYDAWERFESAPAARAVLLAMLAEEPQQQGRLAGQQGPVSFPPLAAILGALARELTTYGVRKSELRYRHRTQAAPANAMALLQSERRLLARPGEVFERAFARLTEANRLPSYTLANLSSLKPPLRALAQSDPGFLLQARHPGRRLLQLLIHASLASDPASGQVQLLEHLVGDIILHLQTDSRPMALEAACARVEAFLQPLLQAVAVKRDECIVEALRQDRDARAAGLARHEVMKRLEANEVPRFIAAFLLEQWARVLAHAQTMLAAATEPPMVQAQVGLLPRLVQLMDDLLWSVAPKADPAERSKLQQKLPALVGQLREWSMKIAWDGRAREAFFEQLACFHAALLLDQPASGERERLQQRMDAIERDSEIALERRAREQQDEILAPVMRRIDALEPGDWVEFVRNDGSPVFCRLAWLSVGRARFVFIVPPARMAFVIGEELFAQGLHAGRARIITSGDLFQSALSQVA